MPNLIVEKIDSLDSFLNYLAPWNDLWHRSNGYEPLSRGEGIELYVRHFSSARQFSAILVWDGEQLVGGLPLLHTSKSGVKVLSLPANEWVNAGELLVSADCDVGAVVGEILQELKTFRNSVLCFDHVRFEADPWKTLIDQIKSSSGQVGVLRTESVGQVDVGDDWQHYFQSLSGNHRSSVRRAEKKIRKAGEVSLLRIQDLSSSACAQWMRQAFEIENRSWKRENGTSILASPGMAEYFLAEAELARQAGMLELWFLQLDGKPIAFEYCHRAHGVCLSYKIGYDEAYKQMAPGKVLRKLQLEILHRDDVRSILDTKGTLCSTKAKWVSRSYTKGRLLAATHGAIPKLLLSAYLQARPLIRHLRPAGDDTPIIELGGASSLT